METNLSYRLTPAEYRSACYFGMRIRYHKTFFTMLVAVGLGIVYIIAGRMGAFSSYQTFPLYIIGAYFLWCAGIVLKTERSVRRGLRSEHSVVGKEILLHIKGERFHFRIPDAQIDSMEKVYRMTYVYEHRNLFLLYFSPSAAFLLPHRCLSAEEVTALRSLFAGKIPERFESFYLNKPGKSKKHPAAQ